MIAKRVGGWPLLALLLFGCSGSDKPAPPPSSGRAVGVKAKKQATRAFCEKSWKPGERKFARPGTQPLPGGLKQTPQTGDWTWVNLWATWCKPCIEEMALLQRWHTARKTEGKPFKLELWTIDQVTESKQLEARIKKGLPGPVQWLVPGGQAPFFRHMGVDQNTPIPIHALVDPKGDLRCVRVGAIHSRDYAQVRQLFDEG